MQLARVGSAPDRPTEIEIDIYPTNRPNAPVFGFIHGGNWQVGAAMHYGYLPRYSSMPGGLVVLEFIAIKEAGGDLG